MKMDDKNDILIDIKYAEPFEQLSGDDVKRLVMGIFSYVKHDKVPDFSDNIPLNMLFPLLRSEIDRKYVNWKAEKERRIEAGKKGAAARWPHNDENQGENEDELPL